MTNKKIIITGGTGFIGQYLARYFGKQNEIILLSRQVENSESNNYSAQLASAAEGFNIRYVRWDGKHLEEEWLQVLNNADVVINLAGKSVNCRYTEKNKRKVLQSRLLSTKAIGDAIQHCSNPPKLWLNASSATIYKNSTDQYNDEKSGKISELKVDNMPFSFWDRFRFALKRLKQDLFRRKDSELVTPLQNDFSVAVCKQWEEAFFQSATPSTRKIALRSAITLGNRGVMIPYFNLIKWGLGGHQGTGQQKFSWIHEEDFARCIEWFIEHEDLEGSFIVAAPNAISNATFMKTLGRITHTSLRLPAPGWMLEAGALLIGTETELILKSRWVYPKRLLDSGFEFKFPQVAAALENLVKNAERKTYKLL
ncbi:MAG: DUF1731 domain-containing protein [Chitinophagaceae bacterium]|nr:DUF1731 domain-containing protein [Chitinophagaceae bacterium]